MSLGESQVTKNEGKGTKAGWAPETKLHLLHNGGEKWAARPLQVVRPGWGGRGSIPREREAADP